MILLQILNKHWLHKIKIVTTFFIFYISVFSVLHAEVIKPSVNIAPNQVIKIQLDGLMKNDEPSKDIGIIQTWEFAHPNNRRFTGPIERFKEMIKGESYSMLLNHKDHEINEVYKDNNLAIFEVYILGIDKRYFKFKWQVEKYLSEGPLKNCWLTTVVSQPEPITDTA
tara:strand:- start:1268 stop:1771 length:504 start_codon:yes stop_codon:yes gene_type:complete